MVRRSAALAAGGPFAPDFRYQEYLRFGRGPVAALAAAGRALGTLAAQGALAFRPLRRLAAALAPAPGEGPSERTMDGGSFRCDLVGIGERGTLLRGRIAGRGDPGNRATTTFVCEAALALALDVDQLPGGGRVRRRADAGAARRWLRDARRRPDVTPPACGGAPRHSTRRRGAGGRRRRLPPHKAL